MTALNRQRADHTQLYNHVKFLTTVNPPRNYANVRSLEHTASYIHAQFHASGVQPHRQAWTAGGQKFDNIIASYNADKTKTLVIGAHYDVCGDQPGADDNASAVAGLLELARMVFAHRPKVDYRIDFVAYCLEEPPFFATREMGSYVHAKSLHDEQREVMGMVCLEMIGYFSDKPNSQQYPSPALAKIYPSTANFIVVVGIEKYRAFNETMHRLMSADSGIDVQVISFPAGNSLAGLSDHRNYWEFGYPALMINDTSFVRNPHYHQKTDTIETLDFPKMTEVVTSAYQAITGL
ncbi:MAG TPA: M28 family peptidase [Chryseosolibacter sp.]